MYKVYQRTLVVDERLRYELEHYQLRFHVEVYQYIFRFLTHRKSVKFNPVWISDEIPKASKWCIYQIAKRCFDTYTKQHIFQFERSSVWSASDVMIQPNVLYLKKSQEETIRIPYLCVDQESYAFMRYTLKRVDIVKNDDRWFVNFLVVEP